MALVTKQHMIKLETIYQKLYQTYGQQHWWPADSDLEMMIGAVLVQNTSWTNAEKALNRFENFDGSLILSLSPDSLMEKIRPAGFFRRKAQTIRSLLLWFQTYGFDKKQLERKTTADLRRELLAIPGIGPETCDCILLYSFERPVFIVDNYLKRLLAKSGYPQISTYDQLQTYVMAQLPQDVQLFQEFHALIVAYGKIYLQAKGSAPEDDPLSSLLLEAQETAPH